MFFTTFKKIKEIVEELDLKMDCIESSGSVTMYKIYCQVPEHYKSHLFLGSDYRIGYGLEICEFFTKGYFVWNDGISYLTDLRSSTDHHWTAWGHPILFTRVKAHLVTAKKLCKDMDLIYKEDIIKKNIEDMENDFA